MLQDPLMSRNYIPSSASGSVSMPAVCSNSAGECMHQLLLGGAITGYVYMYMYTTSICIEQVYPFNSPSLHTVSNEILSVHFFHAKCFTITIIDHG